jgi:ANTAR domain
VSTSEERFKRLQSVLAGAGNDMQSLVRLCEGCVEELSASGAGVSVVTGQGHRDIIFATDQVSSQIEELQVSLGEGPCIDAWSSRLPVMEPDLSHLSPTRWPVFGPAALAAGAAAVFALPLQVGLARVGALDVYRRTPGGLSGDDMTAALAVGDALTRVLLRIEPSKAETGADGWESPSITAEVYQAAGMLTVQLGVDIPEALARLRAHAYAEERPLREVAHEVVARKLRLERDH